MLKRSDENTFIYETILKKLNWIDNNSFIFNHNRCGEPTSIKISINNNQTDFNYKIIDANNVLIHLSKFHLNIENKITISLFFEQYTTHYKIYNIPGIDNFLLYTQNIDCITNKTQLLIKSSDGWVYSDTSYQFLENGDKLKVFISQNMKFPIQFILTNNHIDLYPYLNGKNSIVSSSSSPSSFNSSSSSSSFSSSSSSSSSSSNSSSSSFSSSSSSSSSSSNSSSSSSSSSMNNTSLLGTFVRSMNMTSDVGYSNSSGETPKYYTLGNGELENIGPFFSDVRVIANGSCDDDLYIYSGDENNPTAVYYQWSGYGVMHSWTGNTLCTVPRGNKFSIKLVDTCPVEVYWRGTITLEFSEEKISITKSDLSITPSQQQNYRYIKIYKSENSDGSSKTLVQTYNSNISSFTYNMDTNYYYFVYLSNQ